MNQGKREMVMKRVFRFLKCKNYARIIIYMKNRAKIVRTIF